MDSKELINWRKLSEYLSKTSSPDTIRSNRTPKQYKEPVKELLDLIEYWKSKHQPKTEK